MEVDFDLKEMLEVSFNGSGISHIKLDRRFHLTELYNFSVQLSVEKGLPEAIRSGIELLQFANIRSDLAPNIVERIQHQYDRLWSANSTASTEVIILDSLSLTRAKSAIFTIYHGSTFAPILIEFKLITVPDRKIIPDSD